VGMNTAIKVKKMSEFLIQFDPSPCQEQTATSCRYALR
jgi:hypothetical protein